MTTTMLICMAVFLVLVFLLNQRHTRNIDRINAELLRQIRETDAENERKHESWKSEIDQINRDHEARMTQINNPERWN